PCVHGRDAAGPVSASAGTSRRGDGATRATGTACRTATITESNTRLSRPEGIAFDAAGDLYVANVSNNSITVYAAGTTGNATPTATIAGSNTGLNGPTGIALDAAGHLKVANNGNSNITAYGEGE